ncbi:MAG: tetratricopeptide repeat protein [Acidobacteriota bacterium]
MKRLGLSICVLAASALLCFGQRQEIKELQRDMALLTDQVRQMQRSIDENMAALKVLVQQALDGVQKVNTTVAVLDSAMRERLREQEKTLVGPVATMGAKFDQMATEFQHVRDSIADLNAKMGKLEQRLVDLDNTIKVIQSPPTPPSPTGAATSGPPPGVSAEGLYAGAMRDKDSGNYDLALQGFNEYLKYFSATEMAPNAQYYIGEIYYGRQDLDNALKAFDMVLEKYPENTKTLDAMYMKGQTLVRMGERMKGAEEFRAIIQQAKGSELARKAAARLKEMGLPATAPTKKKKTAK